MRVTAASLLVITILVIASCGDDYTPDPTVTPTESETDLAAALAAERIELDGDEALVWGSGERAVVLVHGAIYDAASWTPQAERIAAAGLQVVAVEAASPGGVSAALDYLSDEHGIGSATLLGASAGAGPVFEVAASEPERVEQIIILAGAGDISSLGTFPKLFIAAEGDGLAAERAREMAENSLGNDNEVLIVDGSAHAQALFLEPQGEEVLQAILDRLASAGQ